MANIYSIENLLVGHYYRSRSVEGEIVDAEKHPSAVWYGQDTEAYLVRIRSMYGKYVYRTLAVSVA